ncbi:hypothetical protein H4Q26_011890 [Puccinia striiformis f. sp. tritici PST-130]|nr:hypothetical protein H4Q26_011890 [Puccinia striiformis f. sp. tritici PST-130]
MSDSEQSPAQTDQPIFVDLLHYSIRVTLRPYPEHCKDGRLEINTSLEGQDQPFCELPTNWRVSATNVMFGMPKSVCGNFNEASEFLHEELPIRLAHRVKELNELPNRLNEMPSILKVRDCMHNPLRS